MELIPDSFADVTPTSAIALQKSLRTRIRLEPFVGPVNLIGGADISFNPYSPTVYAGFVVLDANTLQVVERASAVMDVTFPYIPGLLSFRELPPLLEAWKKLKIKPDVIVFDGQGIAHPRRLGIASHAGLILNWPSIGCAKSLLTGVYDQLGTEPCSSAPLLDRYSREQLGFVYRAKKKVNPVYISPGHRMDFDSAFRIVTSTFKGYRIPEPTRQAHIFVNQLRQAH